MTKATMVLASLLAVTAAPFGAAALLLAPAPVAAAEAAVSAAVGKPLKAAQDAIARKRWDQALNAIKQAQAVQPRTAYDDYKINELLFYVNMQQGKSNEAARLLEQPNRRWAHRFGRRTAEPGPPGSPPASGDGARL